MTYRTSLSRRSLPGLLSRGWLAAAFVLLSSAAAGQETAADAADAQQPTSFFSEAIDVRVINVDVFVTDRSGQPVAGLPRESFELRVDGKVMPISNFYAEAGGVARESVDSIADAETSTSSPRRRSPRMPRGAPTSSF